MLPIILALMANLSVDIPVPGAINPAVTQANIHQTICVPGYTATIRPPVSYTNKLKRSLMEAQGINWSERAKYELDHKVSLEVGGAPADPNNLWLEPYFGPDNAHEKDRLENRLHVLVCSGKMSLADAQADLAGNWLESFRAVFGSDPD